MSTTTNKHGAHLVPGGHNAEQIARREQMIKRIRALLVERAMSTCEIAAALDVPTRTAYGYLARLRDLGEICKTDTCDTKGGKTWSLDDPLETGAVRGADEHARRVQSLPARQVGMFRHWMDVALFGPARGAEA